ncbi:50S ribosomal protein L15 [Candidatus Micrarchaeota archaeon]|nr:50S ribosomal protein L15 [Candidatus Micrarchaeota archaeon]
MGAYRHVQDSFSKSYGERLPSFRKRLAKWRKEKTVERAEKPSNPYRARSLGYKAKKGYAIARVKIHRGKRARRKADLGRKPGRNVKFQNPGRTMSYYAEQKARKRFRNMVPINSYLVGSDGVHAYFEVILKIPNA